MGLVALWHLESFHIRDRTCAPALAGTLSTAGPQGSPHLSFLFSFTHDSDLNSNLYSIADFSGEWGFPQIQLSSNHILYSSVRNASTCNAGDLGSIPGLGSSPGEGNGNPLQYACWRIPWTEEPGRLPFMGSQESDTTWSFLSFFLILC